MYQWTTNAAVRIRMMTPGTIKIRVINSPFHYGVTSSLTHYSGQRKAVFSVRVTALGLRVQCYTKWEKLLSRKLKSRNF